MNSNKRCFPLPFRIMLSTMLVITLTFALNTTAAKADTTKSITQGDYGFTFLFDPSGSIVEGIALNKYTGSSTEVTAPSPVIYQGVSYPEGGGSLYVDNAFAGNTTIMKLAIPNGYEQVIDDFSGCKKLEQIAIGDSVQHLENGLFADCPQLKHYYLSGDSISSGLETSGIGQSSDGKTYPGIIVYTKKGSVVDKYIQSVNKANEKGNQITLKYLNDPYKERFIKPTDTSSDDTAIDNTTDDNTNPGNTPGTGDTPLSGNTTIEPTKTPGEDNTPLEKGASQENAEKRLTTYSKEADPAGSKFSPLQLKTTKVTNKSITVKWKKVKKAQKYILYGAKCGKGQAAKFVIISANGKTSAIVKSINKESLAKGTYYKFIVIALDKNKQVLSTSKIVHVVTSGGKYGNCKSITTKAKKGKITLKVKKSFRLRAKAVPASKKKPIKQHRKIVYESTKPSVASVSKTGKITGKKAGICYVYAYAQNGVNKKIKVKVKK